MINKGEKTERALDIDFTKGYLVFPFFHTERELLWNRFVTRRFANEPTLCRFVSFVQFSR